MHLLGECIAELVLQQVVDVVRDPAVVQRVLVARLFS